jgi:nicotinate-nucleotide adenylyltransferase
VCRSPTQSWFGATKMPSTNDPGEAKASDVVHTDTGDASSSDKDDLSAPMIDQHIRRIGLFGGSFDPIHIGHLILAEEARFQLNLDRVYLVPAGEPPHKRDQRQAHVEHRVRMAQLATADADYIRVSRIDVDRPGPHYTADLIRLVRQRVGPQVEIYFLMGMDSLNDLPTWHEASWLVENCHLVAMCRHDVVVQWDYLRAKLPGIQEQVILVEMPEIGIASHILRQRYRTGQPIRYQVPRLVEQYIREQNLYRQEEQRDCAPMPAPAR